MDNLLRVLPLAIVMVAGPQIVVALMLATSRQARRNSAGYVAGAIAGATLATTVFYYLGKALDLDGSRRSGGPDWFGWLLVGLLLVAAVRVFLRRADTEPPKYLRRLQNATPARSLLLGFLLFLLMPTDLIMTFTVGTFLASHDEPWRHSIGFLIVTALLVGAPLLALVVLGRRADAVLPSVRRWMNDNSWVVSEVVIALFLVLQLQSLLGS
ncbi:GAP family protein [Kribbella sp. CA-247076]|uniref:GAP family protein n=1 Tax=Kribbella sp. CA-247076 TaxID=3239941 RepID=UPI003D8CDE75